MFCTNCGSKTDANDKFCTSCGTARAQVITPSNEPYHLPSVTSTKAANKRVLVIACCVLVIMGIALIGFVFFKNLRDTTGLVGRWEMHVQTNEGEGGISTREMLVMQFNRNGTGARRVLDNWGRFEVDNFYWDVSGDGSLVMLSWGNSTDARPELLDFTVVGDVLVIDGLTFNRGVSEYTMIFRPPPHIPSSGSAVVTPVVTPQPPAGAATPDPAPPAAINPVVPEPVATPEPFSVGDNIQFGLYNWRVLDVWSDRVLIITEYIVSRQRFHYESAYVTWETSAIRQYLNNEFFYSRFSQQEQSRIAVVKLLNHDNPWYGTYGGNDTYDRIFLLSMSEAVFYFSDSWHYDRTVDAWAIREEYEDIRRARRSNSGEWSYWRLRTPGVSPRHSSGIGSNGFVDIWGIDVGLGGLESHESIRPALWLYLDTSS